MAIKIMFLICVGLIAGFCCGYQPSNADGGAQLAAPVILHQSPPTPKPTPTEDTARYVAWMEKQGKPLTDKPHEDVLMRIGDWGFFYHGERSVGSFAPPLDRTALDRSGHAVTEKENSDWFALLSTNGLDAAQALKRVAWLFNSDGLLAADGPAPSSRKKISDPSLSDKDGVITFQGWCEAHSDPPYEMRITIVAAKNGTKISR